ncbi:MAG TPA: DUF4395 domain-containing protein [Chloroflexota bacterium]|nr:DUF4395 domain-containing protein [Chloroflexota bacterium]
MGSLFRFPNPVNEISARLVAAGVALMGLVFLETGRPWLLVALAYGFVARVLTGPTLSPLGLLVTKVITPRLPFTTRWVPGPPKRFAQAIGAALTISAAVLEIGLGQTSWAFGLIVLLVIFATLEAVFAFCMGCQVFAILMALHLIPEEVCLECRIGWQQPYTS